MSLLVFTISSKVSVSKSKGKKFEEYSAGPPPKLLRINSGTFWSSILDLKFISKRFEACTNL